MKFIGLRGFISAEYWHYLINRVQICRPGCSSLLLMPSSWSYFCVHWLSCLISNFPTEMTNNNIITEILQVTSENYNDWSVALSLHRLWFAVLQYLFQRSLLVLTFSSFLPWTETNIFQIQTEQFVFVQDKISFVKEGRKQSSDRTKCVIQQYDLSAVIAVIRKWYRLVGFLTSPPGVLLSDVYWIQVTASWVKKEPENCKITDGALDK